MSVSVNTLKNDPIFGRVVAVHGSVVDIAFALFGRLHAQLQMHSLAFPAKMLATLGMLAALCRVFPSVYEGIAAQGVAALVRLAG